MTKKNKQDWNDIILNSIADGIFTINCNQDITYFNSAAEKITPSTLWRKMKKYGIIPDGT